MAEGGSVKPAPSRIQLTLFAPLEKGVLKMKGYGGDVNDAIEDLGTKVKEFQDEATTCSMITIGRAYECSQKTQIMVNNTHDAVQKLLQAKDELKSMLTPQSQAQEAHQGPGLEKFLTNLYNSLYQQCAADERFDAINGISEYHPASHLSS